MVTKIDSTNTAAMYTRASAARACSPRGESGFDNAASLSEDLNPTDRVDLHREPGLDSDTDLAPESQNLIDHIIHSES